MKRLVVIAMLMVLLAGCTNGANNEGNVDDSGDSSGTYPESGRVVSLIVPFSAGGSSDVGTRIVSPYFEDALGTTVNVVNQPGASGWVGWEKLLASPADGYTISLINLPTIYSGYLDSSLDRDKSIEDFQAVANFVSDFSVLAINKDETRFTDIASFIEFAKNNEVTISTSGAGSDDDFLVNKLKKALDVNITAVPMSGASEAYAAVLGGHVDAFAGNVGDVVTPMKNNEIDTVAVFSKERSDLIPSVPTWNESGFEATITNSSDRGFAVHADTPEEIVSIISEALNVAINDPELVETMAELGLEVNYMNAEEANTYVREEEAIIKEMSDVMGW